MHVANVWIIKQQRQLIIFSCFYKDISLLLNSLFIHCFPMTFLVNDSITCSETSSLANQYLIPVQSLAVDLHAWDSSLEISSVSDTCSHPDWVVGRQSDSSNTRRRHKPRIHEQTSYTGSVAVRCTNELPFSRLHATTGNSSRETPSSSTCKPCK